jgi:hypothetical protein
MKCSVKEYCLSKRKYDLPCEWLYTKLSRREDVLPVRITQRLVNIAYEYPRPALVSHKRRSFTQSFTNDGPLKALALIAD